MKMEKNLSELFNLAPPVEELKTEQILPVVQNSVEKKDDDFDLARDTLRNLVMKNEGVLDDLIDLARNSESPRAFEVVGQLVKTQSDIAKGLMDLHKQKKDIEEVSGDSHNIKTQNNIVFAGSTSDLMKLISAERSKVIDAK